MAVLIQNEAGIVPDCNLGNKNIFDTRTENTNPNIIAIQEQFTNYSSKLASSPDDDIKNFARATSFPVADIIRMIQNSPQARYLRVYNALTSAGGYATYIAPISDTGESLIGEENCIISKSCCQCKPCGADHLLNPEV